MYKIKVIELIEYLKKLKDYKMKIFIIIKLLKINKLIIFLLKMNQLIL